MSKQISQDDGGGMVLLCIFLPFQAFQKYIIFFAYIFIQHNLFSHNGGFSVSLTPTLLSLFPFYYSSVCNLWSKTWGRGDLHIQGTKGLTGLLPHPVQPISLAFSNIYFWLVLISPTSVILNTLARDYIMCKGKVAQEYHLMASFRHHKQTFHVCIMAMPGPSCCRGCQLWLISLRFKVCRVLKALLAGLTICLTQRVSAQG